MTPRYYEKKVTHSPLRLGTNPFNSCNCTILGILITEKVGGLWLLEGSSEERLLKAVSFVSLWHVRCAEKG